MKKKRKEQEIKDHELALALMKEETSSTSKDTSSSVSTVSPSKKDGKETLEIEFPTYWEPQDKDHQIFHVKEGSNEYNSIVERFTESSPHAKVKKVQRNQNRRLWMWYLLKKQDVEKNAINGANEKFLFHGSRKSAYDVILKEGLDHRVAELGGAIGAGVYFATQSSTSMGYISGSKKMLMCRVTLGDVGKGKHGLRRPPQKSGKGTLYDSVSNGGTAYVIFDNHQSYPEYIVSFY